MQPRNIGKCHDIDQGIRWVYTVTITSGAAILKRGCSQEQRGNEMTVNIHEVSHLSSNHEDLDTRIVLHAFMQQQWGIKEILGNVMTQTRVSDVFIL